MKKKRKVLPKQWWANLIKLVPTSFRGGNGSRVFVFTLPKEHKCKNNVGKAKIISPQDPEDRKGAVLK